MQDGSMRRRGLIMLGMLALLRPLRGRAQGGAPEGDSGASPVLPLPLPAPLVLTLTAADLLEVPAALLRRPDAAWPEVPPDLPVIDPGDVTPEAALLRRLVARGAGQGEAGGAGGLAGVVYDNRDRGHSSLPAGLFPQITRLAYGPDLRARRLDMGLALPVLLPAPPTLGTPNLGTPDPDPVLAPVIGNSSTAVKAGAAPRSLPRLAMTQPGGAMRAWTAWAANQTWVYPEHRDHDAEDLFPANWPYMLISQGSSYTDQPHLRAVAMILAALPAATRAAAAAQGLIGPVVQMVFRRAQVRDRAAYLSGAAHPTVFDGKTLNVAAMVARAAELQPDALPPLVRLAVLAEDFADAAGLAGQSERLFDTPSALARVWRGPAFRREMRVTAATTLATAAEVQRYLWVLLRGDPARVRITPEGPRDATARITVDWQEARPIARALASGPPRTSGRVDVGVFAETAAGTISAPAFVSVSFALHEARVYGPASGDPASGETGGGMRLVSVDYDAAGRGRAFDPMLHWSAPWRDAFTYAPDGSLAGVLRTGTDGTGMRMDAQGRRADGRAPVHVLGGTPEAPVLLMR
jgi:hypothetical protein